MPYFNKQRSNWTAQVIHCGKRYTSHHSLKKEALRWEKEKKKELQGVLQPSLLPLSLYELAVQYLDYAKARHSAKTYAEKRIAFRQLFKTIDPHMQAPLLHKGQVLSHFQQQARTRSGNASNKDRKNLVAAWNWAVKYLPNFPQENPFFVHKCAEERMPRYVPPEKDFWAVYNVAESEQDKLMLLCYLHLAARKSEIFHLRLEDVDLDRHKVRLYTCKRKDGSMQYDWLPLTDRLHKALAIHIAGVSGKCLFTDPRTGLPYVERSKWVHRLCQVAGVANFGLHGIRHLSASILISNKVSLTDVQMLLRHTNMTTTQRYCHRLDNGSRAVSLFDKEANYVAA